MQEKKQHGQGSHNRGQWDAWLADFDMPRPLEVTDLYTYTSSLVAYQASDALGQGDFPRVTMELYIRRVPERAVAGIRIPYLITHGIHELAARLACLENPRESLVKRWCLNPILGSAGADYWAALADGVAQMRKHDGSSTFELWGLRPGEVHFPGVHPVLRLSAPYHLAARLEPLIISTLLPSCYGATYAGNIQDILEGWNETHPDQPARVGLEFGLRRGLGVHAATAVSLGAYVGGIYGTSNTHTGLFAETNLLGTVAHNLMQLFMPTMDGALDYREAEFAHWDTALRARMDEVEEGQTQTFRERMDWESLAFVAIAQTMGERAVFLLDTVDTVAAARKLVWLYRKGLIGRFLGVRLDSGDLPELANRCSYLFIAAGMEWVKIFASNDLSLSSLPGLLGSRIDTLAIGTNFERSDLSAVLKEVEVTRRRPSGEHITLPVCKPDRDEVAKTYLPGAHERIRLIGRGTRDVEIFAGDLLCLDAEGTQDPRDLWIGTLPSHHRHERLLVPYITSRGVEPWLTESSIERLHLSARTYAAARRRMVPWANMGYPTVPSQGAQALLDARETSLSASSFVPRG